MAAFLQDCPLSGEWRWYPILTTANGQPALGYYAWLEREGGLPAVRAQHPQLPRRQDLRRHRFICRTGEDPDPEVLARMPEQAFDERALAAAFGNFGLPERLD